ncbi:hypothetical protein ABMC89_09120 [Sulfitobacter sp. HNIBRBA3233]|uniref:hypothetical protein n=1 Tax=Sulfitobacter marinivivus TaxID=3158558 RepID=UPI0032DEC406
MAQVHSIIRSLLLVAALVMPAALCAQGIDRFAGDYAGSADFIYDGEMQRRDMSTTIEPTKQGFVLTWTSVSYKAEGRTKAKTYRIEFVPSARENIYQSAMKQNLFGKEVPLDPLQGEPFVWARLEGDTLSVFSLFINETGEYEIQEFHRILVDEGLALRFLRIHNGAPEKEITTLLRKQD